MYANDAAKGQEAESILPIRETVIIVLCPAAD